MTAQTELKLLHADRLVGIIRNVFAEGLEYGGDVELTSTGENYLEMFNFMTDEENFGMDPPVDESMIDDWYIEEPDGKREKIGVPAVHEGKEIYFRFLPQ